MLHFPGQREDEEVLTFVTKHWIVHTKIVVGFFTIVLLPLIIFLTVWFKIYSLDQYYNEGMIVGLMACFYLLYSLLFTCIRWIDEEFDIFILTTDRLIDVTQISLLKRSVTSTPLEQIQDTTGTVNGFFGTVLHYGDLTVQTAAGSASDFFIDRIPDPEAVAQKILDWADKKRMGEKIIPHLHAR